MRSESVVTENGDIVGYWKRDAVDPDCFMEPVGMAIRRASQHLAQLGKVYSSRGRRTGSLIGEIGPLEIRG